MNRLRRAWAAAFALLFATFAFPAFAAVTVHFQSFDGSVLFGRYPHTFVVMEGTLDATGARINENYGFTARSVTPAVLRGPVEHMIYVEKQKYVEETNRHISITVDDATYWRIRREVDAWRNIEGDGYDLNRRNCIHFVGAIARIVGAEVDYPSSLLRKPRAWLNRVVARNPQLHGRQFD
ncbi:hypothetical protein [Croceicoccus sp. YJ47]|uniref:hypothetical protein n=1 Tax=Croceicoccus sp. YJ47 TaxID=2798724 RepID=UPI00192318B8|nr:hypothetical protein [Croceicoccus sp. YJ47]QQN73048.1 hypothetical protein JD971_09105 [Croceicoccus sp. YJ47]